MATRATIACKQPDGQYTAVYLHFDGYPDYAGKVLEQHYRSIEAAQTLIDGGDIRSLAEDGTPERFTNGNRPAIMPTKAALNDFARNCGTEWIYIFETDSWKSTRV